MSNNFDDGTAPYYDESLLEDLPDEDEPHLMELNLQETGIEALPERYLNACPPFYSPDKVGSLDVSRNNFVCIREIGTFTNLVNLDVSNNSLCDLPEDIGNMTHLRSLSARNNLLEVLPKSTALLRNLESLTLSGNRFTVFPVTCFSMPKLRSLHLGGNQIESLPFNICDLQSLMVLYLGGNHLREIPATIGRLLQLTSLGLCDNFLETIPPTVAELQNLETLSLHNNRLTTLPTEIVKLRNLQQLSLRGNPLVHHFVSNMSLDPPKLKEIAGRYLRRKVEKWNLKEILPKELYTYLHSANQCVNPKCKGVYFEACVEHVKFVDFCGKYRVPLLQFLCSPKCSTSSPAYDSSSSSSDTDDEQDIKMRKVLLG